MTASRRRLPATIACIVLVSTSVLSACGDDGDGDEAAESDREFCELAIELDQQEDFPSAPQLGAYRDTAPDEIAESVTLVVDRFLEAIEAGDPTTAYSDPAVETAFAPIDAYEAEHCGIEQRP